MMRLCTIGVFVGLMAAALQGAAIDCGTLASPVACSVQVKGTMEYVFSNFQLVVGNGYAEEDFAISVGTGGGGTGLIEFAKVAASNGTVFFANAGQTKSFTVSYDVTVNAILPGTAAFDPQSIVSFGPSSANSNGFAALQMILTNPPDGVSCIAIRNLASVTQGICNTLPLNTTNALTIGDLGTLNGQSGNVSFGSFTNLLSASFTPADVVDPPTGEVPEPSTWAMLGTGLAAVVIRGRKRRGRA
ncbi:MAG: PEP-CTERM sorting domain-containing protein [Acidobacteriota bacterium]